MSSLEELVFSAYEHGKRDLLFEEIRKIKGEPLWQRKPLGDIYQEAYERVMKK